MPGPISKRMDRKHGHRTKAEGDVTQGTGGIDVTWTQPNPEWPDFVRRWYRSLAVSGQAQYYEQSDADYAYTWAELLAREMEKTKPNAQVLLAWNAACTQLLTTEGARRRARMELYRDIGEPAEEPVDLATVERNIAAA